MFEKVRQQAQEFATQLPRRAFFGKVAQAALPVAAALSGLLVLPSHVEALGRSPLNCCYDGNVPVCKKKSSETCPDGTQAGQCPQGPGGKDPLPACY